MNIGKNGFMEKGTLPYILLYIFCMLARNVTGVSSNADQRFPGIEGKTVMGRILRPDTMSQVVYSFSTLFCSACGKAMISPSRSIERAAVDIPIWI